MESEPEHHRGTEAQLRRSVALWDHSSAGSRHGRLLAKPLLCCSPACISCRQDGRAGSCHPAWPVPKLCSQLGCSLLTPNRAHRDGDTAGDMGGSSRLGPCLQAAAGQGERNTMGRAAPGMFSAERWGKNEKEEIRIN